MTAAARVTVRPRGAARPVGRAGPTSRSASRPPAATSPKAAIPSAAARASRDVFFSPVFVKGRRLRVGGDLDWRPGPFGFRAEYLRADDTRHHQGLMGETLPPVRGQGWYVSGVWAVAGRRAHAKADNRLRVGGPRRARADGARRASVVRQRRGGRRRGPHAARGRTPDGRRSGLDHRRELDAEPAGPRAAEHRARAGDRPRPRRGRHPPAAAGVRCSACSSRCKGGTPCDSPPSFEP